MVEFKKSPASPIHSLPPKAPEGAANQPKPEIKATAGGTSAPNASSVRPLPKPAVNQTQARQANFSSAPFWTGVVLSAGWVALVALALLSGGGAHSFAGLPLANWAIGVSAITSPIGLIWMVSAYLQRAADVSAATEPLRRQLNMITGESGLAEQRIRRFNQAIREQIDLLRHAKSINHDDLMAIMQRVRTHKDELEHFEQNSIHQVKEIQEVIRRSMQHIEQLMEDKFTMLRILDGKLQETGGGVARQTDAVREHLATLLQEVEANGNLIAIALERAMHDSKKLSETAQIQESSLTSAAESAASTLGSLSGKIDQDIAHFLDRATTARTEAERLAVALDAQARTLDDLTTALPVRVSEAETVLRGVADRLFDSEQFAREQALVLSEKISAQADNLQQVVDRFGARFNDMDSTLQQRRADFDTLVARIGAASTDMADELSGSIINLGNSADSTLEKYRAVNSEARRGVEEIALHLSETSGRYESAAAHLNLVSTASSHQLKEMTQGIDEQLAKFQTLQQASLEVGQEVESKAVSAMQNLQHVLERLLATRDATQTVGETLTSKLRDAVDDNETLIVRINEAAQMSVRALGIASETLGKQEGELAGQARTAEAMLREAMTQLSSQATTAEQTMREQSIALTVLMRETFEKVNNTEQRLQDFAVRAVQPVDQAFKQIDQRTDEGFGALERYNAQMQNQLGALQQFNSQVSGMGDSVARSTSEALDMIEQLNSRFLALRTAQDETAQQTIDQFNNVASRLQGEVGSLGDQTGKAVGLLQEATSRIAEQAQSLLRDAQDSGNKLQLVTTALQGEAVQTRAVLQKQADDLTADLARAEQQFGALGDALKQRTDVAHAMIDRVAVHYNEMTRQVSEEMDNRTTKLEQVTLAAQGKVESLSNTLQQQFSLIGQGTSQLDASAQQITANSNKALQQLSSVNDRFTIVQDATVATAQNTIKRLEETNSAFTRQHHALSDAAQNAVVLVQKAGGSFGEQAGKLLETTHQAEQQVRNLSATTTALADQASTIRATMEQQNQRLLVSLADSVNQMDLSSSKLQQAVNLATTGSAQAETSFSNLTNTATSKITDAVQNLQAMAEKTDQSLSNLGTNITREAASLGVIAQQLSAQQTELSNANEQQKTQLVGLFQQLAEAHSQSSEVAERTITRLTDSLQQIARQLGALGDQSQSAVGNIRTASTSFADQSASLLQNAQQAEQQARTVLSVTAALQEQARQLREQMQQEGERSSDLLSTLLGKLASGSSELRDLGNTAEGTLTSLQLSVQQQTSTLSTQMQQISERQRGLVSALDAQRDVLNGLLSRLALAQDETAASGERSAIRLGDSAQQITRQLEMLDTQAQNALASVRGAGTAFADESDRFQQNAAQAETQVRNIISTTTNLQTQAQQMREALEQDSERSGEALNNLLVKITAGSGDLREISGSTNQSLTGLQQTINEQVNTLGNQMQQITERQRGLVSALDAQRDVLNGLLGRLAVAQDETAASGERSALRLNDSATQISRQLEVLDAQAQSALTSVRGASNAFADESGSLQMHIQQTEQQIRNLVSVAGNLQEQAAQVRGNLSQEASETIAAIGQVTTKLEATTHQLKQQSAAAINSIDQAALQVSEITRNSGSLLQQQAESLGTTADSVEAKISGSSEKLRSNLRLVSDAGQQADEQARQLADSAEYATNRLVALRDTLVHSDNESQAAVVRVSERIESAKTQLQEELRHIAAVSEMAVELVKTATMGLTQQSDDMRVNLASSESSLLQAAALLRSESEKVPELLERSADYIAAASKNLYNNSESAKQQIIGTADQFINVTGAVRDTMLDEARALETTAGNAEQTLRSFTTALGEQLAAILQNSGKFGDEQKVLAKLTQETLAQLGASGERLRTMHSETTVTVAELAKTLATIEQKATGTEQRLAQTNHALSQQIVALGETSTRTEQQMLSANQSFREQLERVRSGVQVQIEDINRGLMQITAQLERTGTLLRTTTATSITDVEKIGSKFEQTGLEASHQLTTRTAHMRVATEEVAKLLNGFGDQLDVLLDRLSMAGDGIKRHENDLVGKLQEALSHLGSVAERLEANRLLTANVSDQAVSRLGEVSGLIEKQMNNFAADTDTITGIVRGVGQSYGEQVGVLKSGVSEAQSQVIEMNQTIDTLQQRTDRMRVSLKLQGDELVGSLEQILQQLATASDLMGDATDDLASKQNSESNQKIG